MGKSEERIQQECYRWFNNTYPEHRGLLFHVPNGGLRNKREAQKLKTMGVYPGVSDFLLIRGGSVYCIEMKTKYGTQSKSQKEWEEIMKREGTPYYILRSLDEFKKVVTKIIGK